MLYLTASVFLSLWSLGWTFSGQNTPPVFDMKREWLIPEDEPIGRRVTTVRTRDDEGDPIEYGIEPAVFLDGSSYFTIDKKTGEVFVGSPLTGLAGNDYYLFITANDGHQTAKIEVYVRILKPNDSPTQSIVDNPLRSHGPLNGAGVPNPPFHTLSKPLPGFFPDRPPPRRPRPKSPVRLSTTGIPQENNESTTISRNVSLVPVSSISPEETSPNGSVIWNLETDTKGSKADWSSTVFPLVTTVAFAPVLVAILWLLHRRCRMQENIERERV